ncbi:helix-turn-helix domain-containing protein [Clostridium sp. DSM 100503]|uniref:helix-turn-helix domain-containing protein n=1 Tax=Clostridium sp. DSM 100503 TaxID=2963282 RepID=UPI00214A1F5F|nr:helix-turn-helix domain-containing protein [Clostridium sp. DSM 100503]MCR1952933.1 helix-turn-helix domain-containing protein [Clostridium sp. DSM 100503]
MLKIYTVQEVCDYLKVSKNTVYGLINQGELKCKKVGRAYKITENALCNYVSSLEN